MGASIRLSWLFLTLLVLFQQDNSRTNAEYMPSISWDPRNPIFDCPSRGINTILVKMRDYVSLVCPNMFVLTGTQNNRLNNAQYLENIFYIEPENAHHALTCNVTGYTTYLDCNRPMEAYGELFRVSKYSSPGSPLFSHGKLMYFIGTGDGSQLGLKNRVGGRCNTVETAPEKTYKMILKIRACTHDEELVYKNCTVCRTVGCYNYGCALYNSWQSWTYYRNVSQMNADGASPGYAKQLSEISQENQCIRRRRRTCSNVEVGCDGPSEEVEVVRCPLVLAIPNYQNCTAWANVTGIYRNSTDRCFISNYRNCSVGNLEKMNIPQWKLSETVCPITTMAPTTTPCKAAVCSNWTSSNETYTNATGHCFEFFKRDCRLPIRMCQPFNVTERKLEIVACPTKQASSSTTLYTQLPCTNPVVSTVAPKPKANVDGNWTGWRDCQSGVCKFKCRQCSNPIPQNNGKKCVGDWIKDVICDGKKVDPNTGQRKGSADNSAGMDAKSWAIPIVAALIGISLGAFAMYLIIKHKQKIHHRDYSKNLDSDSASCGTIETRVMNNDYKLDAIKKPKTPEA